MLFDNFSKDSRTLDGYRKACKPCSAEEFKKYMATDNYKKRLARYERRRHQEKIDDPKKRWSTIATSNAKRRAKQYGIDFNLTAKWVYENASDYCPALKIKINYRNNKSFADSPSIDRFDNNAGYTTSNCSIISMKANSIKTSASPEEVGLVYEWMKCRPKL